MTVLLDDGFGGGRRLCISCARQPTKRTVLFFVSPGRRSLCADSGLLGNPANGMRTYTTGAVTGPKKSPSLSRCFVIALPWSWARLPKVIFVVPYALRHVHAAATGVPAHSPRTGLANPHAPHSLPTPPPVGALGSVVN
jgi:hypothetical protein